MKKLITFLLIAMSTAIFAAPYKVLSSSDREKLKGGGYQYKLVGTKVLDTIDRYDTEDGTIKALMKSTNKVAANFTLTDFDEAKGEATVRGSKHTVMVTKAIWDKYQEAGGGNEYFEVTIIKAGDKLRLGITGLHEKKK